MQKECRFNSDDCLSNKNLFYEAVQYLQNLNHKTLNSNSNYGCMLMCPFSEVYNPSTV